jgi:hypothetical protein
MGNTGHGREALLLRALTSCESERTHRAAMKTAEKTDEARPSTDITREFQRAFHSFGAGLAEKTEDRFAHRRQRIHFFADRDLTFVTKIRRNMQEFIGSIFDCLNYVRM